MELGVLVLVNAGTQSATAGMLPPSDSDEDEDAVAPAKKAGQVDAHPSLAAWKLDLLLCWREAAHSPSP